MKGKKAALWQTIPEKRESDRKKQAEREEQLRVNQALDAIRSEPGRMTAPIEREPRVRMEKLADGTRRPIKDHPGKTLVEITDGDEHNPIRGPDGEMLVRRSRSVDTIGLLLKNGSFDREPDTALESARAARAFHAAFQTAQLNALRAQKLGCVGGGGREDLSSKVLAAKERVAQAMAVLGGHGSPIGSAVWYIAGMGDSIAEFARRHGWAKNGRSLNPETAQKLFVDGIAILRDEWATSPKTAQRHVSGSAA